MIPNAALEAYQKKIFNEGLYGNTLKGVLHKAWPGLDGNPTTQVADFVGYSPINLKADDDSLFDCDGDGVALKKDIAFGACTSGSQEVPFMSICDGTTSEDHILAVLILGGGPIRSSAFWVSGSRSNFHTGTSTVTLLWPAHGKPMGQRIFALPAPFGGHTVSSGTFYFSNTYNADYFGLSTTPHGGPATISPGNNRFMHFCTHDPPTVTKDVVIRIKANETPILRFG